jgi:hypothetical protein
VNLDYDRSRVDNISCKVQEAKWHGAGREGGPGRPAPGGGEGQLMSRTLLLTGRGCGLKIRRIRDMMNHRDDEMDCLVCHVRSF